MNTSYLSFSDVKVKKYSSTEDVPAMKVRGDKITFCEFYRVRNAVVSLLKRFGPVGPTQYVLIDEEINDDGATYFSKGEPGPEVFFVFDDLLHEYIKVHKIEVDPPAEITRELLSDLWCVFYSYPDWSIALQGKEIYVYMERESLCVVGNSDFLSTNK